MYNYFMLIGRVAREVELRTLDDGRKVTNLTLAVKRPFKNVEGDYDTDFFNVTLWSAMAELGDDRIQKGQMIGIKGRVATRTEVLENGYSINLNELIGERFVFLSNNKA